MAENYIRALEMENEELDNKVKLLQDQKSDLIAMVRQVIGMLGQEFTPDLEQKANRIALSLLALR